MSVNYIDIVISIIFLFFIYRGFTNGFVQELAAIFGLLGGFLLARSYAPDLAVYISDYTSNATAHLLAFILIILSTVFTVNLIARLISSFLKVVLLGWLNHLLGAFLGLAKGILLTCALIFVITPISSSHSPFLQESMFLPYYDIIIEYLAPFLETHSIL